MERNIKACADGFIGASRDVCYRIDLSPQDIIWISGLNTGQRALILMDFLYHVEMGMDLDVETETTVQNVIKLFEDYLIGTTD